MRSPEKETQSGLGALLRTPGVSAAGDEIIAVQDFIVSRDALQELNKGKYVERSFSAPHIDMFSRFGGNWSSISFESLFKYYKKRVEVKPGGTGTVLAVTVRAYQADEAHYLNERLLELSEGLVNRLNDRSREDLIRFAQVEVSNAEGAAQKAALALSSFRNAQGIVDPERQATVQLNLVSKLQDELIATKTQLLQLRAFTPLNPQVPVLETRVKGLAREIDEEVGKIAGGQRSLAGAAVQYQRLTLESQFADKRLTSAMASLQDARDEARRKQVYLERIVQPSKPDAPLEPRRMRIILSTLVVGLVAWGILSMLVAGVREHKD
ncbi:MAG: hypothetical protein AB7E60_12535 [Sphingobium sp.]